MCKPLHNDYRKNHLIIKGNYVKLRFYPVKNRPFQVENFQLHIKSNPISVVHKKIWLSARLLLEYCNPDIKMKY